jgi:hypothetical protein
VSIAAFRNGGVKRQIAVRAKDLNKLYLKLVFPSIEDFVPAVQG